MNIKEKYNRVATYFDYVSGFMERKVINHAIDLLDLQKKDVFLDLACGTGKVLYHAAKKTKHLHGCDFSQNMIKVAKKRASAAQYTICNITKKLPYQNHQFDKINFSVTLGMIPEDKYKSLFREIRRVLKPKGKLVITEYTNRKKSIFTKLLHCEHLFVPVFQDCKPLNVRQITEENGFKVIKDKIKTVWGFPFEIVLVEK